MTRTPGNRPSIEPVSMEDTARAVVDGVAALDADRAASYAGLGTLQNASAASLDREQRLLVRKYGANHPRVTAVETRRAANVAFQSDLAVAHTLAATPAPGIDPDTYVFHGHVRDEHRGPLPGLTVALYNPEGEWLSEIGYACTDEKGYFILRHERSPENDEPPAQPASTEVRVYDASQTLLHREAEPLSPRFGVIDYREIIICGEGTCTPPPGAPDEPPPASATVPDVVGKPQDSAQAAIEQAGLEVEASTRETDPDSVGTVLVQDPRAGSKVAAGSVVRIVVGVPHAKVTVPNLTDLTLTEASAVLEKIELTFGTVEPDGAPQEARVVQQSPAAGEQVDRGSAVDVVVELPATKMTVPNLVNLTLKDAKTAINKANLIVGVVKPDGAPDETVVVQQSPDAGSMVDEGSPVDLVTRKTDQKVAVPNLVGMQLSTAKKTLDQVRLKTGSVNPVDSPDDSVVDTQSPAAGTAVEEGTPIDLKLQRPAAVKPGPDVTPGRRATTRRAKKNSRAKKK